MGRHASLIFEISLRGSLAVRQMPGITAISTIKRSSHILAVCGWWEIEGRGWCNARIMVAFLFRYRVREGTMVSLGVVKQDMTSHSINLNRCIYIIPKSCYFKRELFINVEGRDKSSLEMKH
jgi:hypothetical protein